MSDDDSDGINGAIIQLVWNLAVQNPSIGIPVAVLTTVSTIGHSMMNEVYPAVHGLQDCVASFAGIGLGYAVDQWRGSDKRSKLLGIFAATAVTALSYFGPHVPDKFVKGLLDKKHKTEQNPTKTDSTLKVDTTHKKPTGPQW